MEENTKVRSLQERIGLSVVPADPATLVARLVEIEGAGVDHIWVGGPPWNPDLLTTLTAAAMRTTHLKLGTAIVQIFSRHPVLLAQQALSLNALAPGRLRLGLGTSSPEFAKSVYGVEMERPLSYLREYTQVLRSLLYQGEAHYQGRYFTTDASLHASAQLPLLIATLGPGAFRLAGEVADGALSVMCPLPYLLNTALPAMRAGADAAGRPRPPVVAHVQVAFTKDRATALQIGRQAMSVYHTRSAYRNMFVAAGFSQQEIDTVSDSFIESLLVFGDESKIRDRLLELLEAGIDELTLGLVPVSDANQEGIQLARLIGQL
ncbi:LLM class F420-dependent oxidoreductase [Ktedonobacter sp. SOSP1-85]|uniref:LLM class flavin-dependent oxidoreductase n=1 Tax=Ktedonobacter sp. SOSP1-85 TaxID=2778367 RepID=UPI0019168D6D|nr:LLM class flavin-dependent oxidoreductase [Ktedonobacter sp. SOSP1-85]GHO78897.1 LLM class F420-dependent oxidoreductase [Ktedonobacter sp. SOSP1-85]